MRNIVNAKSRCRLALILGSILRFLRMTSLKLKSKLTVGHLVHPLWVRSLLSTCTEHAQNPLFAHPPHCLGLKLLHSGTPKWVSPEHFFVVASESTDTSKEIFNMKIFSIKFVIKKVILTFGVKGLLLLT